MTLLERDLDRKDIKVLVLRNPVALLLAVDAGDAILVEQPESYSTRAEADAIRQMMNQERPDNVYALGPSTSGPEIGAGGLVPNFKRGRTSIYAGPLKSRARNSVGFRRIMEAMS